MTEKLHDLRLRELPNGGFVLTHAGAQPGWVEYEIGAYGNAHEAIDAIWGIISPKPPVEVPEEEQANVPYYDPHSGVATDWRAGK